jgi:hypothetical protein
MCLRLWLGCCDFLARFAVVWVVSGLDYGWVVSSWYCFNFLGAMFSCFLLVSATSSYADDIVHIKISMSRNLGGFHSREDGVFVSLSFFMVLLTTCCV